jgi:hypothetical protein
MTMAPAALPALAINPAREVPTILEAVRVAGIDDGMLARALGVRRSAVCNWRQMHMPTKRKRAVVEILRHLVGLVDPMDPAHVLTRRGQIVRDAVAELLKIAIEELPAPTPREQSAAQAQAYRALHALGVARVDPLAPFEPIGDLRDGDG